MVFLQLAVLYPLHFWRMLYARVGVAVNLLVP